MRGVGLTWRLTPKTTDSIIPGIGDQILPLLLTHFNNCNSFLMFDISLLRIMFYWDEN